MLDLNNISFAWPGQNAFRLSFPRFRVAREESVLLLGGSGSGKSTLLSLICGTVLPQTGEVSVDGQNLSDLSSSARDRFRAERIGMIFQQFNLLPFATVLDNIRLPLGFAPDRRRRAGEAGHAAQVLCDALELPKEILKRQAGRLSVGQQQRVAVARALIGSPPIIIADEPTSALDEGSQNAFLDCLFAQVQAQGSTLLMVSHDARLAPRFDRTVRIEEIAAVEHTDA